MLYDIFIFNILTVIHFLRVKLYSNSADYFYIMPFKDIAEYQISCFELLCNCVKKIACTTNDYCNDQEIFNDAKNGAFILERCGLRKNWGDRVYFFFYLFLDFFPVLSFFFSVLSFFGGEGGEPHTHLCRMAILH